MIPWPGQTAEAPVTSDAASDVEDTVAEAAVGAPTATEDAEAGAETDAAEGARPAVVGVGMSAGGLEAFSQLLDALPEHPGFAIVLVQHLSPHHESALPLLLSARTPMPVTAAEEGATVDVDHVYVIPPDVSIELADNRLHLSPRSGEPGPVHPVDLFLQSLATAQGDRAVAVILSGTGSDGVVGARAVKARGGTVLAQEPATAAYDGMPRATITAGVADLVAPPAELARHLVQLAGEPAEAPARGPEPPVVSDDELQQIFALLRAASGGVDFSHYKQPTIKRRIVRRMALNRVADVAEYVELLSASTDEARSLYQDLLIHVTRFFREPQSFEALAESVFPKLLRGRRLDSALRIWVAGCATGEEAYSLAIALWESAGESAAELNVQIFGTDVSDTAIEFARQGQYPVSIAEDVSPERLRRFFTKVDDSYRISKAIRDLCVFARQDLTRDPPFSNLDLVLCRNVLIYMDAMLQRTLLPLFHYALRPDGFLVLGHAETVGAQTDLFTLVDKKHRIYRKSGVETALTLPAQRDATRRIASGAAAVTAPAHADPKLLQTEANRVLLERYAPPGVLLDDSLEVVQFRGRTGPYLEPAPGEASLNVLKLAREGLLNDLRSALQSVRASRRPVRKEGLRVRSNGSWTEIDLEVLPLTAVHRLHYLVLFHEHAGNRRQTPRPPARREASRPAGGERRRTERVERELAATREYLQSIIQEVEAANEELQSANEEILSSNEELQSTNEELDTAKEELQSTNEELNTLNEELHSRNDELTRVNSDLVNLLGSVNIAIVIVTGDLRIRRFTPTAEKLFNLISADVGRPLLQVRPNIECPQLGELISGVIDSVTPVEREVRDRDGRWYSLRIRPYKGAENRIEGAVMALLDVDVAKQYEIEVTHARQHAEAIVEAVRQPLAVLDRTLRVRWVNESFGRLLQLPAEKARGRLVFELADGKLGGAEMRALLQRTLAPPTDDAAAEQTVQLGADGPNPVSVYARRIAPLAEGEELVMLGVETAATTAR